MRRLFFSLISVALLAGCATKKADSVAEPAKQGGAGSKGARKNRATPILPLTGKVVSVNAPLRFVVLDFSLGGLPAVDQVLNVYRQGQKVAEVKVSGPQVGMNIVADVTVGLAQIGDEVRLD